MDYMYIVCWLKCLNKQINSFSDKPTVRNDAVQAEESTDLSTDDTLETIIETPDSIKDNSAQVSDIDTLFKLIHLD